ncbi:MAG: hypothetical protein ABMA64_06375 [Myxococcota bacterium]
MRHCLIGIILFATGCQTQVIAFEVDHFTDSFVPGVPELPPELQAELPPMDASMLQRMLAFQVGPEDLARMGVSREDVSSLRVVDLSLEVLNPEDGADLGFLSHLESWVLTEDHGDALLVSYGDFAEGMTLVDLPVDKRVNLANYAFSESFETATFPDGEPPLVDTKIRANITLEVGVSLQGIVNQVQ